jgi:hypothetical protein
VIAAPNRSDGEIADEIADDAPQHVEALGGGA